MPEADFPVESFSAADALGFGPGIIPEAALVNPGPVILDLVSDSPA